MNPYYEDEQVTLYLGDCRDVMPHLDPVDLVLADPPYGETRLEWDAWPSGWAIDVAALTKVMWCFGSLRMFTDRWEEFRERFTYSQDLVWHKNSGSGFKADRFMRVHELAALFYHGPWADKFNEPPREKALQAAGDVIRRTSADHLGRIGGGVWKDDGTRLMHSVRQYPKVHKALHPTQKPVGLLGEMIAYSCPPGGVVLDPFAGSGSTAVAARLLNRRAVLIEGDKRWCDVIVQRLQQQPFPLGDE